MRIKGTHNLVTRGGVSVAVGQEVDLPDDLAERLEAAGLVEFVEPDPEPAPPAPEPAPVKPTPPANKAAGNAPANK